MLGRLFHNEQSIIRRSVGLYLFFLPGLFLNFLLIYFASHILEKEAFAIFYTSLSVINVLIAPAFVLNMYLARHFSSLYAMHGSDAVARRFAEVQRCLLLWGLPALLAVFIVLKLCVHFVIENERGMAEDMLLLLIVAVAYVSMPLEAARSALQGQQRFLALGWFTLFLQGLRLVLCAAGLYMTQRVWPGMLGMVVALSAICLFYSYRIAPSFLTKSALSAVSVPIRRLAGRLAPFTASYSLFVVIQFTDVLLAFVLFDKHLSGIYAASSSIPKAILLLLNPVIQISFPLASLQHASGTIRRETLVKGMTLTFIVGTCACVALYWLTPYICGGTFGVSHCDNALMQTLLFTAIPLSLLRFMVLLDFARHRDLFPLYLALPLVWFVLSVVSGSMDAAAIAKSYLVFCWIMVSLYAIATLMVPTTRSSLSTVSS